MQAIDGEHLAWADLSATTASTRSRTSSPLRVNDSAELVADLGLCARFAVDGKPAGVVADVIVAEAYIHCAKALRRAALWSPESWLDADDLPSAACIIKDHAALDADVPAIETARLHDLEATLWEPGGSA